MAFKGFSLAKAVLLHRLNLFRWQFFIYLSIKWMGICVFALFHQWQGVDKIMASTK